MLISCFQISHLISENSWTLSRTTFWFTLKQTDQWRAVASSMFPRAPVLRQIPPEATCDQEEGPLRGARLSQQRPGRLHHHMRKWRWQGERGHGAWLPVRVDGSREPRDVLSARRWRLSFFFFRLFLFIFPSSKLIWQCPACPAERRRRHCGTLLHCGGFTTSNPEHLAPFKNV